MENETYSEMTAAANYNDAARVNNWAMIDGDDRPDGPRAHFANQPNLLEAAHDEFPTASECDRDAAF